MDATRSRLIVARLVRTEDWGIEAGLIRTEGGEVPEGRGRRRDGAGLMSAPTGRKSLGLDAFQYPTEAFVGLKNLEIVDTVATREGEEHEGEDHLGVGPAPGGAKLEMVVDHARETEGTREIEIEGKARKRGHASLSLLFFVLVREDTLWHNRNTSLVIGFVSQTYSIILITQGQRGFLLFLVVDQGL